jgi:hypothetical protein
MKRAMVSAGGALLLVMGVAVAADEPELKEGLWSVHTQATTNPGGKKAVSNYTICRNHAFDQTIRLRAKAQKSCTMVTEIVSAGKYSSKSHCAVGGTTIDTTGTTTYQGDTATHSESHGVYTPAMPDIGDVTMVMDQKYIGSCPAKLHPGDRTNSDGSVVHLGQTK